jgi:hypothetical protein
MNINFGYLRVESNILNIYILMHVIGSIPDKLYRGGPPWAVICS